MLRIFMPIKIQRLRPALNPQTWVPEASMLNTRPPKPSLRCIYVFKYKGNNFFEYYTVNVYGFMLRGFKRIMERTEF